MPRDYYDILGVGKGASDDDIKKAFRKLAHQCHPDKPTGDAEKFKEINNAYQVLGDAGKRKQYDQFGPGFEQAGGFGGGAPFGGQGGFNFNGVNFDFGGMNGEAFDLGDVFASAFGMGGQGGRAGRRESRGRNIEMDVQVTFAEAAFGTDKDVSLYTLVACKDCDGSGAEKGSKLTDCGDCKGSGQVRRMQQTILGSFATAATCPRCDGRGKVPEKPCHKCKGAGVTRGDRTVSTHIPAGIADGQVLQMTGGGEAAPHGGRAGDLYLRVRVKPDVHFVRHGFDVRNTVEVGVGRAALGGEVTVKTLDGDVSLTVPAGTQPGTEFRLKGRGVPHLNGRGRGDHFVTVSVRVPKKLTREQRAALEEWGEF